MTKTSGRPHEPMQLDAGKLGRVEFLWTGDRYRHQWHFPGLDESLGLLRSVESNAEAIWPISPPLQQVHLQSFDDGREVIFGVGMSGRGHWSASFTMVPELKGLDCRVRVSFAAGRRTAGLRLRARLGLVAEKWCLANQFRCAERRDRSHRANDISAAQYDSDQSCAQHSANAYSLHDSVGLPGKTVAAPSPCLEFWGIRDSRWILSCE